MDFSWWGWNARTGAFSGTLVFTVVQAWGLWNQNWSIWRKASGASVSIAAFISNLGWFSIFFLYGIANADLAVIINGLVLALLCIPVLIGLARYRGFNRWQKAFCAAVAAAVTMTAFSAHKDRMLLGATFGSISFALQQPLEIWRKKSRGVVSIRFICSFLVSTVFWVVYSAASGLTMLLITSLSFFTVLLVTLILWLRYPRPALTVVQLTPQRARVAQR